MGGTEKDIKLHTRFLISYKKNTVAIFFSFALTFLLLTVMLTLIHTNFQISNLQKKIEYAPVDCYIDHLSEEQIEALREDSDVERIGLQQGTYHLYERNKQTVFLMKCDKSTTTMTSTVTEGRVPERSGEIAAEKWILLNLGIEPVIGQTIELTNHETGNAEKFQLTGILSDIYRNKKAGLLEVYTPMDLQTEESYLAFLQFTEGTDYTAKIQELQAKFEIAEKQIKECPAREEFQSLYILDGKIIFIILFICMVVFYGIYRIASLSRLKQYGILRAIGMKKKSMRKMILSELYQIYLFSVPVGIIAAIILARFVMVVSGDAKKVIYIFDEAVKFHLVIPVFQILICVIVTAICIGIVGYGTGKHITNIGVTQAISSEWGKRRKERRFFSLDKANSKTGTLFQLGCKYILQDLKTSGFVILTISLGVVLFTGLAYKAKTLEIFREDTRELYYLNGQYAMTMLRYDNVDEGVSRQSAEKIRALEEVVDIKTSSGLPVRVIDENVKRNESYYQEYNERLEEIYGYSDVGYDGKDQIYKSKLCGYNTSALQALKPYVVEGNFNPEQLGENEVILSILRTDDTKSNEIPESYREGTPLMEYHAGDEITFKYRTDLQTGSLLYDSLQDKDSEYVYRTMKVVAIAAFPYMLDCDRTVYPLLITADQYIREITPDSAFQCLYLDGKQGMSMAQQTTLERTLIQQGSKNANISTRSLVAEIEQNEMFYHKQMVYIYGIGIITFILVIINMVNNLRYRMQTRTREVSMLRAVGLSVTMTKKMIMFENIILCMIAVFISFILSWPVLRYLYSISDMRAFGHNFRFAYAAFILISAGALIICAVLSLRILKQWKSKKIIEGIGDLE